MSLPITLYSDDALWNQMQTIHLFQLYSHNAGRIAQKWNDKEAMCLPITPYSNDT